MKLSFHWRAQRLRPILNGKVGQASRLSLGKRGPHSSGTGETPVLRVHAAPQARGCNADSTRQKAHERNRI